VGASRSHAEGGIALGTAGETPALRSYSPFSFSFLLVPEAQGALGFCHHEAGIGFSVAPPSRRLSWGGPARKAEGGMPSGQPARRRRYVVYSPFSFSFSLCPRSRPKEGWSRWPVILIGNSVCPSLRKKGSTTFSTNDFMPVVVCEILACIRSLP